MMLSKVRLSIVLALTLACCSALLPLTTYAVSLAIFGMPHIYYELAYIKERYAARMSVRFIWACGSILAFACILNLVMLIAPYTHYHQLLLTLFIVLVIVSYCLRQSWVSVLVVAAFSIGIYFNPLVSFFVIAFLHNFSPWLFLKERQVDKNSLFIFVLIPIGIFLTSLYLPGDLGLYQQMTQQHFMSHYVPNSYLQNTYAKSIFTTAVYLQLIHYDCTIRLFPKLMHKPTQLIWPVAVIFMLITLAFMMQFMFTRSVYAIFAGFHAWLEVPVFLVLLQLSRPKKNYESLSTASLQSL